MLFAVRSVARERRGSYVFGLPCYLLIGLLVGGERVGQVIGGNTTFGIG
jgi:hypothetical protein